MTLDEIPMTESSQMRYPWRATLRTSIAAAVGLLPILPVIADAFGWMGIPWVASVVAISAGITRVLATPAANKWLEKYADWLLPTAPLPRYELKNQDKELESNNE